MTEVERRARRAELARIRYAANPEKNRAKCARDYAKHREKRLEAHRQYCKANRAKRTEKQRRWVAKKRGIELLRPMPDNCELCDRSRGDKQLHYDHDHHTGQFRGWLCHACNTSIGKLGDTDDGLERAVAYLRRAA